MKNVNKQSRFRKTYNTIGMEEIDDLEFPTMIMTVENDPETNDVFLINAYYDDVVNRKIYLKINLGQNLEN